MINQDFQEITVLSDNDIKTVSGGIPFFFFSFFAGFTNQLVKHYVTNAGLAHGTYSSEKNY